MKKLLLLLVLISFRATALVYNVPAQYATIQAALTACTANDTVLVQPGTYTENISWPNVAGIKLLSAGDSTNTIINGNAAGRVISITVSSADTNTLIQGFTITNGFLNATWCYGSGVYINNAGAKIDHCHITANGMTTGTWGYGIGLYCYNSTVGIYNSTISNNTANSSGYAHGTVYISNNSSATLENVTVRDNVLTATNYAFGGGIYCGTTSHLILTQSSVINNTVSSGGYDYGAGLNIDDSQATLTNVLVAGNIIAGTPNFFYGGGIYANNSTVDLNQVTVAENHRDNGSTINGSGLYARMASIVTAQNCIFWNVNSGADVSNNASTVTINYSDVRGGFAGSGNINSLPLFVSASDFHLTATSPCINTGTLAGAPPMDIENNPRPLPVGTNPDMGAYEFDQLSTGGINYSFNTISPAMTAFYIPAENVLLINTPRATDADISVFDAAGKEIFQSGNKKLFAGSNSFSVMPSNPAAGIYYAAITSGAEMVRVKFYIP